MTSAVSPVFPSKQKARLLVDMASAVEDSNTRRRRRLQQGADAEAVDTLLGELGATTTEWPRGNAQLGADVRLLYSAMVRYRENADLRYQLLELKHLDLSRSFVELEGRHRRLQEEQRAWKRSCEALQQAAGEGALLDGGRGGVIATTTATTRGGPAAEGGRPGLQNNSTLLPVPVQQELEVLSSQRNKLLQANLELRKQLKQMQIQIQMPKAEDSTTATCPRCHPELLAGRQSAAQEAFSAMVEEFHASSAAMDDSEAAEELMNNRSELDVNLASPKPQPKKEAGINRLELLGRLDNHNERDQEHQDSNRDLLGLRVTDYTRQSSDRPVSPMAGSAPSVNSIAIGSSVDPGQQQQQQHSDCSRQQGTQSKPPRSTDTASTTATMVTDDSEFSNRCGMLDEFSGSTFHGLATPAGGVNAVTPPTRFRVQSSTLSQQPQAAQAPQRHSIAVVTPTPGRTPSAHARHPAYRRHRTAEGNIPTPSPPPRMNTRNLEFSAKPDSPDTHIALLGRLDERDQEHPQLEDNNRDLLGIRVTDNTWQPGDTPVSPMAGSTTNSMIMASSMNPSLPGQQQQQQRQSSEPGGLASNSSLHLSAANATISPPTGFRRKSAMSQSQAAAARATNEPQRHSIAIVTPTPGRTPATHARHPAYRRQRTAEGKIQTPPPSIRMNTRNLEFSTEPDSPASPQRPMQPYHHPASSSMDRSNHHSKPGPLTPPRLQQQHRPTTRQQQQQQRTHQPGRNHGAQRRQGPAFRRHTTTTAARPGQHKRSNTAQPPPQPARSSSETKAADKPSRPQSVFGRIKRTLQQEI